ncbi:MAG: RNB domain-containing ribonuclease [Deltaproteobacteria bacterium]|nr:RNB domain-containing ribonuclease [Deltaproteobacteria bacterium]
MESGNVVEFIESQKIMCAVVLEIKKLRLRLLTETNREVKMPVSRLSHKCDSYLDLSMGRDKLVASLKKIADRRSALIGSIDVKELWEILNTEQEWIDLQTMTEFCFSGSPTQDHESAVVRAFFNDRHYFKFKGDQFFPLTEEQVCKLDAREKKEAERARFIEASGRWVKRLLEAEALPAISSLDTEKVRCVDVLKSAFLFDKESAHYQLAKQIQGVAGIESRDKLFNLLVRLGVWDRNVNLEFLTNHITEDFPDAVKELAEKKLKEAFYSKPRPTGGRQRKDLTDIPLITIDGQATLDFDDALSLETIDGHYRLGIHISDVAHFIKKDDAIDREACNRASSIYTPDQKIPMLPTPLAEGLCSLRADEIRPAISVLVKLTPSAEIMDYDVVASLIKVKKQLSYYDANMLAEEDKEIQALVNVASKFRQRRLSQGALQITLPEINIWINDEGEPMLNRVNRESPARMLVSELMIMANWLMAKFLEKNGVPAVFRSQPPPRERLYRNNEGSLYQNWMQRKLLSRFSLGTASQHHSGLGLDAYVTATSPIRKYFDLVTQRQIRSVLAMDDAYLPQEIQTIIQTVAQSMGGVSRMQHSRNRYWLLKYLEKKTGEKTEAVVLGRRRNSYLILLKEYMVECSLPLSQGIELKPEDLVQVTLQHANARNDMLSVYIG